MTGASDGGAESRVLRCIEVAIRDLNALRAADAQLAFTPGLQLAGEGGALDSLGFVNFVVSLETELGREFGSGASVMGDLLASPDPREFATVEALARFVTARIARAK